MIFYVNKSLMTGKDVVVGLNTSTTVCGLYECLTNDLVVSAMGPNTTLEVGEISQGVPFPDIVVPPKVEVQEVPVLATCAESDDPIIKELYVGFVKTLEACIDKTIVYSPKFTRLGGNRELIMQCMRKDTVLRDGIMQNPEDTLSISVPAYDQLVAVYSDKDNGNFGDTDNEDEDAENATSLFNEIDVPLDFESLDPIIDVAHFRIGNGIGFPYYDSIDYKNIIALLEKDPIIIKYVAGDPENNFMPIRDCEKQYYNELVKLMRWGIAVENNVITDAEIDALIAQGVSSKIVNQYLMDLSRRAYAMNWAHTGNTTFESGTVTDEVEEIASEVPAYYTIVLRNGKPEKEMLKERFMSSYQEVFDGFLTVTQFVNRHVMNSYKWIEALIRLLRWGSAKPTHLCIESISKDKPEYLDLNNLEITSFAGTISNLVEVQDGNGCTRHLTGLIYADSPQRMYCADSMGKHLSINVESCYDILFGFRLTTYYEGVDIIKHEYIDIFTLVSQLLSGSSIPVGFKCERGAESVAIDSELASKCVKLKLSDVLTIEPSTMNVFTPSVDLLGLMKIICPRIKGFDPKQISVFNVFNNWYTEIPMAEYIECDRIVSEIDQPQLISDKRRQTGISVLDLIKRGITLQLSIPFLTLSSTLDPNMLDLTAYVKGAAEIAVMLSSGRSPVRRIVSTDTNPKFLMGVDKCTQYYKITHGTHVVGYFGKWQLPGTKPHSTFYFWSPDEFEFDKVDSITSCISIRSFKEVFIDKVYVVYEREGKLNRLLDVKFFLASPSTFKKIANKVREYGNPSV